MLLDNLGGARRAVEHLIAHGHRRIAFVVRHRRPLHRRASALPATARRSPTRDRGGPGADASGYRGGDRRRRAVERAARRARRAARPRSSPPTTATRSARCARSPAPPPGRAGRLRRLRARRPARYHRRALRPLAPRRPGRARSRSPALDGDNGPPLEITVPSRADRPRLRRGRPMKPLLLPPNQFHRFYRGGARIDALRGVAEGEDGRPGGLGRLDRVVVRLRHRGPEPARGRPPAARRDRGRPRGLPRPRPRRALRRRPRAAGEAARRRPAPAGPLPPRPPVRPRAPRHALRQDRVVDHPRGRARRRRPRRAARAARRRRRCAAGSTRQDADEMLAALQRVPVAAGDAVLVPAGTLHAIGAGILLLELQEPTDLSVLSSGSRSASPTARSTSGSAGRRRCSRWTPSRPTSPR